MQTHVASKPCCTCGAEKPVASYCANSKTPDGRGARCRECAKAANAAWYQANKGRTRQLDAKWRAANPERHAELRAARWARWKAKPGNAEKAKAGNAEKMRNPCRRMARSIWGVLRGRKQGKRWTELLGYTEAELRAHLERQFTKGMSWENYGSWHIDHIIPVVAFTITGPECPELRKAWALSNLRPLWAKDNLRKNDKIETLL